MTSGLVLTLINDIPTDITDSWVLWSGMKESTFEPSSSCNRVSRLLNGRYQALYTEAGPDHSNNRIAGQ